VAKALRLLVAFQTSVVELHDRLVQLSLLALLDALDRVYARLTATVATVLVYGS
jgi:hypothetical protein